MICFLVIKLLSLNLLTHSLLSPIIMRSILLNLPKIPMSRTCIELKRPRNYHNYPAPPLTLP
ncbi:hypothetical protein OnM2_c2031o19 [Erysiphe neolycopersici]|uniref:Uncharacterized protein n=1 Tax=Erysiphe neolycopersici TaxID=212602 RepID=A0A420I1U3_9PEZI|nr:hypothetical protein OnM2_c2031o19 [Erysiphe neolycopersici]